MYLSFAVLPRSVRAPMGLAYLLCRAADTMADGATLPVSDRQRFLDNYKNLFQRFPFDQDLAAEFYTDLSGIQFTDVPQDQRLLENLSACFKEMAQQSLTDQALIGKVVGGVIAGMEMDLQIFEDDTVPRSFSTSSDFERYLQAIGGEPGRFWSEISLAHVSDLPVKRREPWIHHGVTFGTGLQMVNILRDFPDDIKRGRCYLPEDLLEKHQLTLNDIIPESAAPISHLVEDKFRVLYVDLIEVARLRLMRGLEYLADIPSGQWGLRAAVTWPLLIGLETLKRVQEAPTILNSNDRVKVKRWEIYRLLATTAAMIPFQRWIERKARSIN